MTCLSAIQWLFVCSNDNMDEREGSLSQWGSQMEQMLLAKPGLGTRCMNTSVHNIRYVAALTVYNQGGMG